MPHPGEGHGQAGLVSGGDDILVLDRSARLDHGRGTGIGRGEQAVRDGSYFPADPAPTDLAWHGRDVARVCIGVYAGTIREARCPVIVAAVMCAEQFAPVATFVRSATDDGNPLPSSIPDEPNPP